MAKKEKASREEKRAAADYYKLHSQAVDDLIHADAENSPEVSKEELAKYRSKRMPDLADWAKVLLIKFWFNGSVCFFFFWGLGAYFGDMLDQLVVLGIAMGVLTDLLVNNILRFFAKTPGENDRWMMFPQKGFSGFPLNILYAFLVLLFVFILYNVINRVLIAVTGSAGDSVPLGVEPILFGLFYLGIDLLFLALKHTLQSVVENAKNKVP